MVDVKHVQVVPFRLPLVLVTVKCVLLEERPVSRVLPVCFAHLEPSQREVKTVNLVYLDQSVETLVLDGVSLVLLGTEILPLPLCVDLVLLDRVPALEKPVDLVFLEESQVLVGHVFHVLPGMVILWTLLFVDLVPLDLVPSMEVNVFVVRKVKSPSLEDCVNLVLLERNLILNRLPVLNVLREHSRLMVSLVFLV